MVSWAGRLPWKGAPSFPDKGDFPFSVLSLVFGWLPPARACGCISVAGVRARPAARRCRCGCSRAREQDGAVWESARGVLRPLGRSCSPCFSGHLRPCISAALVGAESAAGGVGPARPRQVSCVSHASRARSELFLEGLPSVAVHLASPQPCFVLAPTWPGSAHSSACPTWNLKLLADFVQAASSWVLFLFFF